MTAMETAAARLDVFESQLADACADSSEKMLELERNWTNSEDDGANVAQLRQEVVASRHGQGFSSAVRTPPLRWGAVGTPPGGRYQLLVQVWAEK